jgi:hypothetical protein
MAPESVEFSDGRAVATDQIANLRTRRFVFPVNRPGLPVQLRAGGSPDLIAEYVAAARDRAKALGEESG